MCNIEKNKIINFGTLSNTKIIDNSVRPGNIVQYISISI